MLGGRLDAAGNVYFAGHTTSADLPVSQNAAQPRLGGQHDGYMAQLSADGSRVLYLTYVGGSGNEFPEHRPHVGSDGAVLMPGVTASENFPTTPGVFQRRLSGRTDAFLTKISPDGTQFEFSTLLGGSTTEFCLMPTVSPRGEIIIVGQTESRDLPVTPDAVQKAYGGGVSDGWLAILSPDGSRLLYCTYLGGNGGDMIRGIALQPGGDMYLVGNTASTDFPVTPDAAQAEFGGGTGDAYAVRLSPNR
jgi:hypothetical protein